MFFFTMFLSTIGTSKVNDCRDTWNSGWWSVKAILLVWFMILPFLFPESFIYMYGELAHLGAGVFILIMLVSVITFITMLNDWFLSEKHAGKYRVCKIVISIASYVGCIVGIVLMYLWYAPEKSCFLNIFYISWTIVLVQLITSVAVHPRINKGFLTPGIMGLYLVYLCWGALRSEPSGTICNRISEASTRTDWLTILSFIFALLTVVFTTFSTGIDSQCFKLKKKEIQTEEDVPYGYGFFHLVFATGSMYFAMLLISWNTHHYMHKWTIDVGWRSTWIRVINEWVSASVYIWMVVAPVIRKSGRVQDIP